MSPFAARTPSHATAFALAAVVTFGLLGGIHAMAGTAEPQALYAQAHEAAPASTVQLSCAANPLAGHA